MGKSNSCKIHQWRVAALARDRVLDVRNPATNETIRARADYAAR